MDNRAAPGAVDEAIIIADVTRWLERAVIGLGLCPFARAPHVHGRLRMRVSQATGVAGLRADLADELRVLDALPTETAETGLLIHPWVLQDFLDYNDFLDVADATLVELGLDADWQIASFHPQYQFAGSGVDDIENHSNRSPWPLLHLLRETSVAAAVDAMADSDEIYRRNMRTLRGLGSAGWQALWEREG